MKTRQFPLMTSIVMILLMLVSSLSLAQAPQTCAACHGENGQSANSQWPNLAGQKNTYLFEQMKAMREGERDNAQMAGMLDDLNDQQLMQIADYYSQQTPAKLSNDNAELVSLGQQRAGYCIGCHGVKGVTVNAQWPNLAGQQADYLYQQLVAFKSGKRKNTIMQTVLNDTQFSDQDLKALSAYFSQLSE